MKYYSDLLELGCFSRKEVTAFTGNENTTGTLLKSYLKKGYIQSVKRNLYATINLADSQPVSNKYIIAGRITPTSYVSHHAAFEFYGCANQVSYQVEVSSETPFISFDFGGNTYDYIRARIPDGVVTRSDGIRVTDVERTVLDGVNDFEKIMGLEELLRCISLIPSLKEDILLKYLFAYDKQFLYQKTGYILRHFQNEFHLNENFFLKCAALIGKSTRYLTTDRNGAYNSEWRLVAPDNLMEAIVKGANEYAYI